MSGEPGPKRRMNRTAATCIDGPEQMGRIVSGSLDAIRRVVAAFEQSDWAEIDVRVGDVRVHLATGGAHRAPVSSHEPHPSPAVPAPAPSAAESAGAAPPPPVSPPDGAHLVVAPSPGIFWRSPEPGAPPFADVGDAIDASATVCIVEVMKLMNHLKAEVSGTVVAVYGVNGVAVQKGELLFAIEPSTPVGTTS